MSLHSQLRLLGCGGSDAHIQTALDMYDGDIERTANYLLDNGQEPPSPATFVINGVPVIFYDLSTMMRIMCRTTAHKPHIGGLKYFPQIDNGDCVYLCLWEILEGISSTFSARIKNDDAAAAMQKKERT